MKNVENYENCVIYITQFSTTFYIIFIIFKLNAIYVEAIYITNSLFKKSLTHTYMYIILSSKY